MVVELAKPGELADRCVQLSHRPLHRRQMIKSTRLLGHEARRKAFQVPAAFNRLKNVLRGRALNHVSAAFAAAYDAFPFQQAQRQPDRGP